MKGHLFIMISRERSGILVKASGDRKRGFKAAPTPRCSVIFCVSASINSDD